MPSTIGSDEELFDQIKGLVDDLGLRPKAYDGGAAWLEELPDRAPRRHRVGRAVAALAVAAVAATILVVSSPDDRRADPDALSATLAAPAPTLTMLSGYVGSTLSTAQKSLFDSAAARAVAPTTLAGLVQVSDRIVVVKDAPVLGVPMEDGSVLFRTNCTACHNLSEPRALVERTLKGTTSPETLGVFPEAKPLLELHPGLRYTGRRLYFLGRMVGDPTDDRSYYVGRAQVGNTTPLGAYVETSPGTFQAMGTVSPDRLQKVTMSQVTRLIRCGKSALWPDCPNGARSRDVGSTP